MSGELSPVHWLIVIGVVVLLFGAKKLPEAARGLGQSMRIFKTEISAGRGEQSAGDTSAADPSPPSPATTSEQPAGASRPGLGVSDHAPEAESGHVAHHLAP